MIIYIYIYLAILCDLFGMVKTRPFAMSKRLPTFGDRMVTLNQMVCTCFRGGVVSLDVDVPVGFGEVIHRHSSCSTPTTATSISTKSHPHPHHHHHHHHHHYFIIIIA